MIIAGLGHVICYRAKTTVTYYVVCDSSNPTIVAIKNIGQARDQVVIVVVVGLEVIVMGGLLEPNCEVFRG